MLAVALPLFAFHWAGSVLAFLHCNLLGGVCIGFFPLQCIGWGLYWPFLCIALHSFWTINQRLVLTNISINQPTKVGSLSSSPLPGSPPSLPCTCRRWNWSVWYLIFPFRRPDGIFLRMWYLCQLLQIVLNYVIGIASVKNKDKYYYRCCNLDCAELCDWHRQRSKSRAARTLAAIIGKLSPLTHLCPLRFKLG